MEHLNSRLSCIQENPSLIRGDYAKVTNSYKYSACMHGLCMHAVINATCSYKYVYII